MGNLSVSMRDNYGKVGMTNVSVPNSKATLANAKKIADWLKGHTDAAVVGYGATLTVTDDAVDEGKYDTCQQRLVFLYKDKAIDSMRRFSYPAPRDEDVNTRQQPISDLAEDVKDLLQSVGALTNDDDKVEYNGGGLHSRLPEKSARSTELTGV